MKKILSFVLALISLFTVVAVNSASAQASDVMPCYNNAISASVNLSISSSGKASVSVRCTGISGVTTKITAETKLERKWGLLWLDVDGGEWTDTTTSTNLAKSHSIQLSKTGTYRATTTFTVSGSGGSNDVITDTMSYVY